MQLIIVIIFSVPITGCNSHYAPCTKEEQIMNIYEFIIGALILLCGILCLLTVLAKCDNIKQLDLQINIHDGIKFKSLFYKKR